MLAVLLRPALLSVCFWLALMLAWADRGEPTYGSALLATAQAKKRSDKPTTAVAKNTLDRGLAALDAKDFPTATRLLSEAFRQSPRPEILFHLARVAAADGQTLVAYDLFRRYLADPAREPDEAAARVADQALASPPATSASLVIQSDPGAFVVVDDRVVGTLPLTLSLVLLPGAHNVVLEFGSKRIEAPVQVPADRVSELRISRSSGAVLLSVLPAIVIASQPTALSPEHSRRLAEVLELAARSEGHTTLRIEQLMPQSDERARCLTQPHCLRDLARANKADWLLVQSIIPRGDAKNITWDVKLRLQHIDISEPAAESELTSAANQLEQAISSLKQSYGKLLGSGLARPRGSLRIEIEPTTATVQIDRQPLATSQAATTVLLWAGRHSVAASAAQHQPQEQLAEVREGEVTPLRIQLARSEAVSASTSSESPPRAAQPKRSRLQLALAGTMVGLGVAMTAIGSVGVRVNGRCTAPIVEPALACPDLYATAAPGGFALGSGIALVGSGILLFVLPGSKVQTKPGQGQRP